MARGFTLIEILVVVVIVGILALALTFSVATAGGARRLSHETERFQSLVEYACNQSERLGRDIGVVFDTQGYAFSILTQDSWHPLPQDSELRHRRWLEGLQVQLMRDGRLVSFLKEASEQPQLVCFASGELTPFAITFALGEIPTRYQVDGHFDGRLQLTVVESSP